MVEPTAALALRLLSMFVFCTRIGPLSPAPHGADDVGLSQPVGCQPFKVTHPRHKCRLPRTQPVAVSLKKCNYFYFRCLTRELVPVWEDFPPYGFSGESHCCFRGFSSLTENSQIQLKKARLFSLSFNLPVLLKPLKDETYVCSDDLKSN